MSDFKGFQSVQLTAPKKSTFDLSHDKRLTTRMGRITPVLMLETVPSDNFNGSSEMLVRLAPLLAPIYDQIHVYVHYFFVPKRLLWQDWEEFITGGRLGVGVDPVDAPIPPFMDVGAMMVLTPAICAKGSLGDYLGVPDLVAINPTASAWDGRLIEAMPFAAYQLIWMEYYRDRNFVADDFLGVEFPMISGDVFTEALCLLRSRAYKHDYFTSALPFTQRGQQVLIPVDAAVTYLDQSVVMDATDNPVIGPSYLGTRSGGVPGGLEAGADPGFGSAQNVRVENIESISNASSTINDFRSAYALQVWLERNAIGGSRYNESTQAHFDVKPQDMRLQRPEYIGGGRVSVRISEVLSTAWSNDGTADVPLANMGGHGVTYGNTNRFRYFCVEHGFIVGLMSIMNPPSYHQGLPRMFRRWTFLDYPWPTFAKLGEQQVDAVEIYASPATWTPVVDSVVVDMPLFGYQSRYADWKFIPNSNHGDFHDTLLFWTLTRDFADAPELGEEFVTFEDATQDRIFAVGDDADNFWIYLHNKITVKRPLPYFGTPNTLGFV